jgi:hypothetical protein
MSTLMKSDGTMITNIRGPDSVTYYLHPDGHATAADGAGWVSALFANLEAAQSWQKHFSEAEAKFKEINGDNVPRDKLLGVRTS